jgi:hypothetical protein
MKTTLLPALLLSGCSMTFYGLKETNEEPPKAVAACPAPPPALATAPVRLQRPASTPDAQTARTDRDKATAAPRLEAQAPRLEAQAPETQAPQTDAQATAAQAPQTQTPDVQTPQTEVARKVHHR